MPNVYPASLTNIVHMHNIFLRTGRQPLQVRTMQAVDGGRPEERDQGPRYVFGPVFSRRLGQSLGIDPVPAKTCNWNCVYCQLGRTVPLRSRRAEYVPTEEVLEEIGNELSRHGSGTIDWVTFVGSGETLLHSQLGRMLRATMELTDLPVAVITNGSLLSYAEVRSEVLHADAVLPSLDAGSPGLFKRINRPHPGIPFEDHLAGLEAFRRECSGKLLLEVMLIGGLNDTPDSLSELAGAIRRIGPDAVHLSSPHRPPAEPWVRPTDQEGFMRAVSILGPAATVLHPAETVLRLASPGSGIRSILGVLARHPMSEAQLLRAIAHWSAAERSQFLIALDTSGSVKKTVRAGKEFWVSRGAEFPPSEEDYS